MASYSNLYVEIPREQVYEDVWTSPISQLAEKYGMSGVGLAKLCRRHQISVPPRGYWAKVHAGHKVRRTPLPPLGDTRLATIRVLRPEIANEERQRRDAVEAEEDVAALLDRDEKCGAFPIPERLVRRHPVTENSFARVDTREARVEDRALPCPGHGWASVAVTKATRRRAELLLEGLLRGLELRGCRVTVDAAGTAAFAVLDSRYHIEISESERSVENPLWGDSPREPRWTHEPSGKLEICLRDATARLVRFCRDGAHGPAEAKLQGAFRRLVTRSAEVRTHRREVEREIREAEEARRREEERREAARRAARARRDLVREARRWDRCRLLRAYAADARERLVRHLGAIPPGSDADRWLAWVESVATEIDPVRAIVASVQPSAPEGPPPAAP